MSATVYDRQKQAAYSVDQYGEKQLKFLYETVPGRLLLWLIFSRCWYSQLNAWFNAGPRSRRKIQPFIDQYGIDQADYVSTPYRSFNDFFERKLDPHKRPIAIGVNTLISPADAQVMTYILHDDNTIRVKHRDYTLDEILCDSALAQQYHGGTCLVFRLEMGDCHRYCFIDDGHIISHRTINGRLHTVQPISAKHHKVFTENYREYTLTRTDHFGDVVAMEVGALLVGKINNHALNAFQKGEEKGYFGLGGSTIILFFQKGAIYIDEDILVQSRKGVETKVHMGETIGGAVHVQTT